RYYAIYRLDDGEKLPTSISWSQNLPKKAIRLVSNGKKLKYKLTDQGVTVFLPRQMQQQSVALEIE
ncbi:alpha-L-fucosidase, partial [Klebsiella pneumoniae]|nr:alpha-L-fucosidase [Klebsiella pneumoniae]